MNEHLKNLLCLPVNTFSLPSFAEAATKDEKDRIKSVGAGFTLIEMVVVMLILGIIAVNVIPTLSSGIEKSKLSGAASEIAIALEYAQLHAMTTGEETKVTIDDDADSLIVESYRITGDIFSGASTMPESDIDSGSFSAMSHPIKKGKDYSIVFSDEERFEGVDIVSAAFGANSYVTFNPIGIPSDGGTVTLSYGNQQVTVGLASLSGRVTSSE
jgi:prepilin-type N-terminal cleavage/methylation domain-containing protein